MPRTRRSLQTLTCPQCGSVFDQTKWWQKYCTSFCNQAAYYKRMTDPLAIPLTSGDLTPQEAEWKRRRETVPEDYSQEVDPQVLRLAKKKLAENEQASILQKWLEEEKKDEI